MLVEAGHPDFQGLLEMFAHGLDIMDFEAVAFQVGCGQADVIAFAAGENEPVDDFGIGRHFAELRQVGRRQPRAGLVQVKAARPQQRVHVNKMPVVVFKADMLKHFDLRDLVIGRRRINRTVIAQFQLDPVAEPQSRDLGGGKIELLLRQCHAMAGRAKVLRGMADQAAPAAADVEKAVAGGQPQLLANAVQLGDLGLFEAGVLRREIGTGINHFGIKKQAEKGIRHIVVELDQFLVVAGARVMGIDFLVIGGIVAAFLAHEEKWHGAFRDQLAIDELCQTARARMIDPA